MGPQSYFPENAPSVLPGPDEDDVVSTDSAEEIDATDRAQELADELDVDLAQVEGTGQDGRIMAEDVEAAADSEPAADETS